MSITSSKAFLHPPFYPMDCSAGKPSPLSGQAAGAERAPVRIHTGRLIQAIANPLENASSFSPPGGTIRLGLRKNGETGGPQKTRAGGAAGGVQGCRFTLSLPAAD